MSDARVLVVGAGPAGLAVATALTCHGLGDEVEVVDPAGRWLDAWQRRFAAQDIPHLRSPAVHHPHPDPFALLGRCGPDDLVRSGGTSLPTRAAFTRFCDDLIHQQHLTDRVTPTAARSLTVTDDGRPVVQLEDGTRRRPDRLVLAGNPRRPLVPTALQHLSAQGDPRVVLGDDAHVDATPPGGHVLVIGGGLSAGHLALGAIARGAHVTLLTRRRLTVRRFDTHPTWLGPKQRRPFEAEADPGVRRRLIDQARGGGTVPHRIRRRLDDAAEAGTLDLRERTHLVAAEADDRGLCLRTDDGHARHVDQVWVATGGAVEVDDDPLCRALLAARPAPRHRGLVDLDLDLAWPGTRVHLVGAASLVLGPTAGNLVGQRRGASRVTAAVRGADPVRADRLATGAGACPASPVRGVPEVMTS